TTGGCSSASLSGSITVNPDAAIALSSAAATASQTLCVNTPLTSIVYTPSSGATGAALTAGELPAGVTRSFADGVFTISGTPTASGTFNYTVTTTGGCSSASLSGSITVNPDAAIALSSAAATASQTLCINTPLTDIVYTPASGATGAALTAGALPAGVTGSFADGVFTISGTPTASGTFNYTVTTTGGCSSASLSGSITVNDILALNGTESTLCAADGSGYILTVNVTGQAPYTATGTGAPGTWNGNQWTSDKILAGVNYNVGIQDSYACNTVVVADTASICCAYEVKVPTFPITTVACYSEIPTAASLTEAQYEALGNGDGNIGDIPCGVIEITAANSSDPTCNGNVIRTYTVTEYADPNNNKVRDAGENNILETTSSTQTFTIQRTDFTIAPNGASTVACPSDVTPPQLPVVNDNCGNVLTASGPVISAAPVCNGIITYTYTFTDCAGHAHDWVYTYTINNTAAPQGTAPSDITVQCIDAIPPANINAVTNIKGNCNNNVTVTVADINNGGTGCSASPYIVTRTYTLTDCGGLTTQLVQTLTAKDTTAPVFVGILPEDITVECSVGIPTAATLSAIDNCGVATVTYTEVKVNGSCSGNYKLQRTWTAVDACGNKAAHTQLINVTDTTAPVFAEALPEAVINTDCSNIPSAVVLTATDNCGSAAVNYTETRTDGDCSARYTLNRTWTAVDECGNQTSFMQKINVSCPPNIYNALSPNGDGMNDTFVIEGIDCFPNNTVSIYNRYGVLIYEKKGYDNVTNPFEGFSDGRATVLKGDKLPTGTYFYILEYEDNGRHGKKSGYLYINDN
ncbi:gliding motility-associated C-terminal domain-containing protein, partial [Flavobacterium artemisiae]